MQYLFESSDILNSPYEGFLFDTDLYDFPIRPHWHYFMEILYMLEGAAYIDCNNDTYVLEPGDMIIFHPKDIHSIYATTTLPLKYYVLKFDINRITSNSTYAPRFRTIFHNARGHVEAPIRLSEETICNTKLPQLIQDYVEEISQKDYGYDMLINAQLSALLTTVLRIWIRHGFDVEHAASLAEPIDTIYTITEYIDEHSGEALRVEDIAKVCHMSYSHFAKTFREIYGQSCKEFIEFIRVCKVEDFLLFTDYDLNYISQETGFSDCSHLIKTFRKLRGVTPKQFRLKRKSKNG